MSTPMVHSNLGASSAYRWMACPGSVSLSAHIPRKDSQYSREGTAAHSLGEIAFAQGIDPSNWVGEFIMVHEHAILVTEEMATAVRVYYEYLNSLKSAGFNIMIEHRFDLQKLNPPAPMFGTSDCVAYHKGERKLIVGDYKHGAGVPVEVEDNSQLKYYALGALLQLDPSWRVEEIEMAIIQPRAPHRNGPVRRWSTTLTHILDYASELIEAAKRTMIPNAELVAGKHCRFCPAQPQCPALHKETLDVAKTEFDNKPLLDPRLLGPDQLGYILDRADIIEDWVRSVRQHVQSELEAGNAVPGWKLVPKRATRQWVSEQEVKAWALGQDVHDDEIYEKKLKSPAAIEKVVGKKNVPADLIVSISSGYTLAPSTDPRPAITNVAADEFSALPKFN